ncbi:hypothetical protein [Tabrizicola flagellatus]|uniref:hypothetical protein n=1 Tax=Tabrizicola flagellatus TaxID=2593021 RepID=UPI0011F1E7CD|nr:hypothetical protein [Tabrizicola flagellatus]
MSDQKSSSGGFPRRTPGPWPGSGEAAARRAYALDSGPCLTQSLRDYFLEVQLTNRVHIDAPAGVIEIEGEKDFVEGLLGRLFPLIEEAGFGSRPPRQTQE